MLIKPNDGFAVDDGYRGALVAQVEQFFQSRRISTHILVDKFNTLLRKKLLLPVTGTSAGLIIDDHHFGHDRLTSSLRFPRWYHFSDKYEMKRASIPSRQSLVPGSTFKVSGSNRKNFIRGQARNPRLPPHIGNTASKARRVLLR